MILDEDSRRVTICEITNDLFFNNFGTTNYLVSICRP